MQSEEKSQQALFLFCVFVCKCDRNFDKKKKDLEKKTKNCINRKERLKQNMHWKSQIKCVVLLFEVIIH